MFEYDFGDESIQDLGLRFPKFDLKKEETARVCVISPKFGVTVRHYVRRIGYVHCHAVKEAKNWDDLVALEREGGNPDSCLMCSMALKEATRGLVGLPARHAATYILRYHTDVRGELLHGQLGYHLEVWLLSNKKFSELHKLNNEWKDEGGLQHHDLEVTCVEAKYKNYDIALKKAALWKNEGKEEQKKIIAYLKEEIEKYPLSACLGEEIPKDILMRRFEIIRRKNFPDDETDLGASIVGGEDLGSAIIPGSEDYKEDPFDLGKSGGEIPSAVTEEEKKEAAVPEEKGSSLDDLI